MLNKIINNSKNCRKLIFHSFQYIVHFQKVIILSTKKLILWMKKIFYNFEIGLTLIDLSQVFPIQPSEYPVLSTYVLAFNIIHSSMKLQYIFYIHIFYIYIMVMSINIIHSLFIIIQNANLNILYFVIYRLFTALSQLTICRPSLLKSCHFGIKNAQCAETYLTNDQFFSP